MGPVDDPAALERAAVIVRADRPAPRPAGDLIGAPRPREPREPREPDEHDERLRALVEYLARGLVDHPDDVLVEIAVPGDDGDLELRVHQEDMGHVIGKQGRTARSLRLVLGAAASRVNRRMSLEIED